MHAYGEDEVQTKNGKIYPQNIKKNVPHLYSIS